MTYEVNSAQAANDFSGKQAAVAELAAPSQKIPLGERLTYQVFWMGVPVGIGTLEVKEKAELGGRPCFHVVAVAQTNDFLSRLYPVRDEVHSWIDAETLQSLQFEKKASEGGYRADERVTFDASRKTANYESLKNGTQKNFEISVPVHDVVSAFYWLRRQTLVPGKSVETIINSDEKDWGLEVDVLRRETKELRGLGSLDTLLVEPKTRLKGILDKRGRVWVHFLNDPSRIPVLITFKTPFGPVVGVLSRKG